jgi:hypothetical protein
MRVLLLIGYLLIAGLLSYAAGMWLHDVAYAHLADRPELNHWAAGLKSEAGLPCCDGSDAEPIIDADWRAGADGHYQVRIEGEWVDVPNSAVVPGPNKYGRALVWGYWMLGETKKFSVRCFMPAGGA